jgi:hypothetical protein
MILQLNPTLDVHTPLGYGKAMFLIDRSEQINSIWKVRMYDSGWAGLINVNCQT